MANIRCEASALGVQDLVINCIEKLVSWRDLRRHGWST